MIEIKFIDNQDKKHLVFVALETASSMQNICPQICETEYFKASIIYNIKGSDVGDVEEVFDSTAPSTQRTDMVKTE